MLECENARMLECENQYCLVKALNGQKKRQIWNVTLYNVYLRCNVIVLIHATFHIFIYKSFLKSGEKY